MADYIRAYSDPPKLFPSTLEGHPKILPGETRPPVRPSVPLNPGRPLPAPSIPSWIHQPTAPPPAFPGIPRLPMPGGPTLSQDSGSAGAGAGAGTGTGRYSPFTPSPPVQHYATGPTLGDDIGSYKLTMTSSIDPTSTFAQELYSKIPRGSYDNHKERGRCPRCTSIRTYAVTNDGGSIMGCKECLQIFSSPESLLRG